PSPPPPPPPPSPPPPAPPPPSPPPPPPPPSPPPPSPPPPLSPSPPPPPTRIPPPMGFPYSGCQINQSTPYNFSFSSITPATPVEPAGDLVCGVVTTQACNKSDPCCNTNLYKLSVHINDACAGSVVYATYNGNIRYPSYETNHGIGKTIFKITQMANYTAKNADGLTICFQLQTPCTTLPAFCYGGDCEIALYNEQNYCCPIVDLPNSLA
ncbi:hypothetical protein CEUSTIGMA_g8727.t1, partial [Chlamydomonas eustigma]